MMRTEEHCFATSGQMAIQTAIDRLVEEWAGPAKTCFVSTVRGHLELAAMCLLWRMANESPIDDAIVASVELLYRQLPSKHVFIGMAVLDDLIAHRIVRSGISRSSLFGGVAEEEGSQHGPRY